MDGDGLIKNRKIEISFTNAKSKQPDERMFFQASN
jgi:hypothetical protein